MWWCLLDQSILLPTAIHKNIGSLAGWAMHHTVFTYPFPTDGTGAGSAAAAKLLVNCSSFCLAQKTAGASWLGYTDRDTAEIQRAWRASRAAAARAALLAPNMLHTLVGELHSGWIHGFSLAESFPRQRSLLSPPWRHMSHGFTVHVTICAPIDFRDFSAFKLSKA